MWGKTSSHELAFEIEKAQYHLTLFFFYQNILWVKDAILAACYLINRMPSSVLHDQIPHLSYYLLNLFFIFLLVSLVVFFLFIFSLLGKTNSLPKPRSVSSWVIPAFRGVIIVILPILIATLSLLMSPSLKIPPSSPL